MSSEQIYDINEGLWALYVTDCRMKELRPNIKDFLIWCDEEDYDRPEVWDSDTTHDDHLEWDLVGGDDPV